MGVIVLSLVLGFSGGGDPLIPIGKMALFIPLAFVVGIFIVPLIIERILHLHDRETRIGDRHRHRARLRVGRRALGRARRDHRRVHRGTDGRSARSSATTRRSR